MPLDDFIRRMAQATHDRALKTINDMIENESEDFEEFLNFFSITFNKFIDDLYFYLGYGLDAAS